MIFFKIHKLKRELVVLKPWWKWYYTEIEVFEKMDPLHKCGNLESMLAHYEQKCSFKAFNHKGTLGPPGNTAGCPDKSLFFMGISKLQFLVYRYHFEVCQVMMASCISTAHPTSCLHSVSIPVAHAVRQFLKWLVLSQRRSLFLWPKKPLSCPS